MEHENIFRRLRFTLMLFVIVLIGGTLGFVAFEPTYTYFEALYMTVITISTIGYTEIIEATNNVPVRIFTMILAFSGIGVLTYLVSNIASMIIEGNISERFKKRNMEKRISNMEAHYIICGSGNVGVNIVNELLKTKREFILAGRHEERISHLMEANPGMLGMVGDPTDDEFLLKLGINKAKGVFVTTGDDNINLVVCVSAKHLNPNITLVAECNEINNIEKLKIAGADRVISPTFIGGLRMASEMIRPTVTGFLDEMMRGTGDELRVEEVKLATAFEGKKLEELELERFKKTLLLSIRENNIWKYHPPKDHMLTSDSTLIIMTTPEDRVEMEKIFS